MHNTTKIMLESEFGFSGEIFSENKQVFEGMDFISENVRELTGFTPEKVIALNDGNNVYIEFANNLERLMSDGGFDLREALDMVMTHNKVAGVDPYIILDESAIDRIDLTELMKEVGADHVLRK